MSEQDRIAALEARVEELEFYISEIQGETIRPPWGLHLTKMEMALANALAVASPRIMSKGGLLTVLYPTSEQPAEKIIDVWVCRVRKVIGAVGLGIITHNGKGYSLSRTDGMQWQAWTSSREAGEPKPASYPEFDPISHYNLTKRRRAA